MDGSLAEYELLDELGRGGMGRVVRARHRPTGTVRAVKLLDDLSDPELLLRFQREAEALARVGGAGIVPIHGMGLERGRAWLAMPLLPGGSLAERIKARPRWAWEEAVRLVLALCEPLARCHQAGIVHRDLKPENVLFDDQDRPCLADFGAARDVTQAGLTRTGTFVGTPLTMPPEQLEGRHVDARADIYALGVILQLLIGGAPPFPGSSLLQVLAAKQAGQRARLPDVPAALEAALQRILDPDPQNRPGRPDELAALLRDVLEGRAPPPRRRLLLAGLGLVGGLGLGGLLLARSRAPQPPAPGPSPASLPSAGTDRSPGAEGQDLARRLEQARLLLVSDLSRAGELIAEVEQAVAAGAPLPIAERDAFLADARRRSEAAWLETPDDLELSRFRQALAPWSLARRLAALSPTLETPPPSELESAKARLQQTLAASENGPLPLVLEVALDYLPLFPGLAPTVSTGLRRSVARKLNPMPTARACELLGEVLRFAPAEPLPWVHRAELTLLREEDGESERVAEARRDLERGLELLAERDDPQLTAQALLDLAEALARQSELAPALARCEEARLLRGSGPTNVFHARLHGWLLLSADRSAEAAELLDDSAQRVAPGPPRRGLRHLANSVRTAGRDPEGRKALLAKVCPPRVRGDAEDQ